MTIKEALDTSFDMEKQGYDFYIKASNKAKSAAAKKIFQALAEDENRHIDAIKKYSENLAGDLAMPKLSIAMPEHADINKRLLFGKDPKEALKGISADSGQLKAYEIAMDLETRGYNFYEKAANSIEDKNIKELYKFLIKEEKAHYSIIASTYGYLKAPQDLFFKEEKSIMEG